MINSQQSIIILGISLMIIAVYLRTLILNQERQMKLNQNQLQQIKYAQNNIKKTENNNVHVTNIKRQRLENRLLPPERSYQHHGHTHIQIPDKAIPIGIHTRGIPPNYQQVGVLVNNDSSEPLIFPLYGRPIYAGSNKWNYYTSTNHYHSMKVTIQKDSRDCLKQIGCDELYDGDTIKIPVYGDSKDFTVTIYQMDAPKYIPYIV